jgi:hypothetical protein
MFFAHQIDRAVQATATVTLRREFYIRARVDFFNGKVHDTRCSVAACSIQTFFREVSGPLMLGWSLAMGFARNRPGRFRD